jgi:hypothetical protein
MEIQSQVKTIETITPGSVDTIPDKNNRNNNSRVCRYNPRLKTIDTITPGSVDTIPGKNNRNHNSRLCRYNPR